MLLCLSAGLAALACLACMTSIASADVDMTGALEKASRIGSSLGGVESLATSANGDYKCTDKYSVVANWSYYYAIGNCPKGAEIEVVSYAAENTETHEHSYGGFVNSAFSGCGWINTQFPLEKQNSNQNSACSEGAGNDFKVAESTFMAKHNGGSTGDGYAVVNKKSCPEYANYRPWSSNNVEKELIRTAPAYAASGAGSNFPALKWRYTTKYESTDGTGQYVMVRDDRVSGGEGNWVFVPRSCLPSTLPENENERIPPKPAVTTEPASGVQTPSATLNGSVNPEGIATTYYFQYGTTTNWNEASTKAVEVGSGTSTLKESTSETGLAAGTTYYYRIIATSAIGTSEGSAQSFTMQPPPSVTTEAATGISQTGATLNASVNPNGLDTHYHFEYGTEAGHYVSSTPEAEAGSAGQVSATISGLQPAAIYHYRVVATSSAGTSDGAEATLETSLMPKSSAVEWGGTRHVYYRGLNGQLREWSWNGTKWAQRGWGYENEVAGDPSAVVHSNGSIDVYYRNTKGQLAQWWYGANWSSEWTQRNWGYENEVASDPSAIVLPNGTSDVYYRDTKGQIGQWWYGDNWSSEWTQRNWGYENEVASDPSAVAHSNNNIDVYYRDTKGQIGQWWYGDNWSSEWTQRNWGYENEVASDPSAIVLPNGTSDVYYRDTKGQIGQWWYGDNWSSEWSQRNWGYEDEVAGDPSAVAHSNSNIYVYYRAVDGQLGQWWYGENWSSEWSQHNWGYHEALRGDPSATALASGGDGINYGGTGPEMWEWHINGSEWWDTEIGSW
jgi:hypothetical protein